MSLEDIKPTDTLIYIDDKPYKVAYDFNAIAKLLELYNCSFSNLANIVQDIEAVGNLEKMIEFCQIGFNKYNPEITIDTIKDYGFYRYLFERCVMQFVKCMAQPDEWEKTIIADNKKNEVKKKKISKVWTYLTFGIVH